MNDFTLWVISLPLWVQCCGIGVLWVIWAVLLILINREDVGAEWRWR